MLRVGIEFLPFLLFWRSLLNILTARNCAAENSAVLTFYPEFSESLKREYNPICNTLKRKFPFTKRRISGIIVIEQIEYKYRIAANPFLAM